MTDAEKRVPLVFFRSDKGLEPVLDWLRELSKADRRIVGAGLKDLEFGWPIGMPLCRALGGGLFELRVSLRSRRIARVMVCVHEGELVALTCLHQENAEDTVRRHDSCEEPQATIGESKMSKTNAKKEKANPHRGSTLDDFLDEEGIREEATAKAAKKALAWQFAQAMREQKVTKAALARRMKTSRAQLDRLLDPENESVTLKTLARAAEILGMRVQIELLDS